MFAYLLEIANQRHPLQLFQWERETLWFFLLEINILFTKQTQFLRTTEYACLGNVCNNKLMPTYDKNCQIVWRLTYGTLYVFNVEPCAGFFFLTTIDKQITINCEIKIFIFEKTMNFQIKFILLDFNIFFIFFSNEYHNNFGFTLAFTSCWPYTMHLVCESNHWQFSICRLGHKSQMIVEIVCRNCS